MKISIEPYLFSTHLIVLFSLRIILTIIFAQDIKIGHYYIIYIMYYRLDSINFKINNNRSKRKNELNMVSLSLISI